MMSANEAVELAAQYLRERRIAFVNPARVIARNECILEVVFSVPEALDPNAVVDPCDVRVKVNAESKEISLIEQM